MITRWKLACSMGLSFAAIIAGCASSTDTTSAGPGKTAKNSKSSDVVVNFNDPAVISEDRLDSICETILFYFHTNQQLPPTLADLQALEPRLILVNLEGQPYAYVPGGLASPDGSRRLIVYDPTVRPNGRRWCIVMGHLTPGAPASVEVVEITENLFQQFTAQK